jgi:peptidoglycan/xylan/chitin deacetylase (PgdA/CDA1 family)
MTTEEYQKEIERLKGLIAKAFMNRPPIEYSQPNWAKNLNKAWLKFQSENGLIENV